MAPKRKVKDESEDEEDLDIEQEKPSPKKKRAAPKKKPASTEPSVDELGWTIVPPSLIVKSFGDTKPNTKVAAFDLDGTMVNTKSGAQFARGGDDWKWFSKKVAKEVKAAHDEGYQVVIFTNQGGIKSALTGKAASNQKTRINAIVNELDIPVHVLMSTMDDDFRKPNPGMWKYFVANMNGGTEPDPSVSYFVGDAAGRPGDFADTDLKFAEGVGIKFKTPEDVFGAMEGKKALPPRTPNKDGGEGGSGSGPNADIVDVLKKAAEHFFATDKKWPGIAASKAAKAIDSYPVKVSLSDYKKLGELQGVGKGTLEMVKEFLETGKLSVLEGDDGDGGGGGGGGGDDLHGGKAPAAAKADANKAMALNFM